LDDASPTSPTAVELFSVDLNSVQLHPAEIAANAQPPRPQYKGRFIREVQGFQRDVARAIAEAVELVATPAAEHAEGRALSPEDFAEHGLMEQRQTPRKTEAELAALPKDAPFEGWVIQTVDFFWKHKPVAILVVSQLPGNKLLIEAEVVR
jgi:hypothetical protein